MALVEVEPHLARRAPDATLDPRRFALEAERDRLQAVSDSLSNKTLSLDERAEIVKREIVPAAEVAEIENLSSEEANAEIGAEALQFKRRDPRGFKKMLKSLPVEEQRYVRDAVAQAERRR